MAGMRNGRKRIEGTGACLAIRAGSSVSSG